MRTLATAHNGVLGKSMRRASTAAALGTRASANTSDQISLGLEIAGEIAELKRSAPNEEKLVSSAEPGFELFESSIQPFDLMSRRHPLSSTRAVRFSQLRKANRPQGSRDVPASSRRQFLEARFTSSS
jgi:hypothetical protein